MEIIEIKSKLTLVQVLHYYHFEPDRNQRLCCPWHDDKTPSLQIYPKTNTWTCFSSNCSAGSGDQIDFIMKIEKISKHEALMKAKELLGHTEEAKEENLTELFSQIRAELLRSKKALSYMEERCLDAKTIEVGYNSYQSGYKQVQNCIVFPLKDKQGNITSLYGRSIADLKGSNHYYTRNRKGLYPSYPSEDTKTIIVTEAIIDAVTLMQCTDYKVLTLYGTNGWNEEHTAAIKSLSQLTEIIFFMDGDEAGQKAVETYTALVKVMIPRVTISQVNTPDGEDINSLLISHEKEIINHLIDNRTFLFSTENKTTEKEEPKHYNDLNTDNPDYITTLLLELMLKLI